MKHIPNILTLLNLFFGCLAIIATLQSGLIISTDLATNEPLVMIPEKIYLASLFIGISAVIDFFDGFVARLLKADSALGKQLDSLSDVVSFGVAPAMIIYQFLRLSFAQQEDGIDVNMIWLLPAFIFAMAGAYRLGRFNIDTQQSTGFKGVPIPAAGLVIASFPMIYWHTDQLWLIGLFTNEWFWYAIIIVLSYLMISTLPMMALKFKNYSVKDNWTKYLLVVIAIIAALLFNWLAVPVVFLFYVILSLTLKKAHMTYNIQIRVMPLKDLLDPQGKAVHGGLNNLGLSGVKDVRIGKHITLAIDAESEEKAKSLADDACKKLLANPVMESYEIEMVN